MTTPHDILEKRAIVLSKPLEKKVRGDELLLLEFKMNNERYGIDIQKTKEVLLLTEITSLPNTPDFILGVMNIRRRVVPVIDLKKILTIAQSEHQDASVIVMENKGIEFAFLVDEVVGSISILKENLSSVPCTFSGLQKDLLHGITNDKLIVLNGDILFSREEFIVQQDLGNNI